MTATPRETHEWDLKDGKKKKNPVEMWILVPWVELLNMSKILAMCIWPTDLPLSIPRLGFFYCCCFLEITLEGSLLYWIWWWPMCSFSTTSAAAPAAITTIIAPNWWINCFLSRNGLLRRKLIAIGISAAAGGGGDGSGSGSGGGGGLVPIWCITRAH